MWVRDAVNPTLRAVRVANKSGKKIMAGSLYLIGTHLEPKRMNGSDHVETEAM